MNAKADVLASFDMTSESSFRRTIPIGYIEKPSIELGSAIAIEADIEDWRTPIVAYLWEGLLPKDKYKARKIRIKDAYFLLINGILCRLAVHTLIALMSKNQPKF